MRPLKLEMQAFGTFLNKTIIDFNQINQYSIYLISGPTGSGKTTIFDAIVFALYGEASGVVRNQKQFRSDFATPNIETYVTLEFELHGEVYKITRNPTYYIDGRKTPFQHKAILYLPNKDVLEGVDEPNKKIEFLLNINAQQFRQIIMLAQGEFTKLIHSSTDEREKIFRKLFDTDIFEKVEQELKLRNSELATSINELTKVIDSILAGIENKEGINGYDETIENLMFLPLFLESLESKSNLLNEEQKITKSKIKNIEDEHQTLTIKNEKDKANNNKFDNLSNLEEELNVLVNKNDEIELLRQDRSNLEEALEIKPIFEDFTQKEKQLKTIDEDIQKAKVLYETSSREYELIISNNDLIEESKTKLDSVKLLIQQLRDEKIAVDNVKTYEKQLEELNIALNACKEKLSIKNAEIKVSLENIQNKENTLKELSKTKEIQKDLQMELKDNNNKLNSLKDLNNLIEKYLLQEKEYNLVNSNFNTITNEYNLLISRSQQLQRLYFDNVAGNLAMDLEEGKACPVCGSCEHPNKAQIANEPVSQDDCETAEELAKNKGEKYENLKNSLYKIKTLKEDYLERIRGLVEDDKDIKEIKQNNNKIIEELNHKIHKLNTNNQSLLTFIKENKDLESTINSLQDKLSKLHLEKETLENELKDSDRLVTKKISEIETIKTDKIIEGLKKDYKKEISNTENRIKMLNDSIINHNNQKETTIKKKTESESKLEYLKELRIGKDHDVKIASKALMKSLHEAKFINTIEILKKLIEQSINLKSIIKIINQYEQEYAIKKSEVEKAKNEIKDLKYIDISLTEDKMQKLHDEKIKQVLVQSRLDITLDNYNKSLSKLTKLFKSYNNLVLEKQETDDLSKIANGNNEQRLSFERFVLCEYFDNVLTHANLRLIRITNDRFKMSRKSSVGDGRKSSGLDIEVFDSETGKSRDITSLSGGESFKAALSLALGLADTIEAQSGGIEIDSLFIDEGFGTLDSESLDQAVQTLYDLKGDNKVVGIISHVAALKEIIDATVLVSRTNDGSKINFKFN